MLKILKKILNCVKLSPSKSSVELPKVSVSTLPSTLYVESNVAGGIEYPREVRITSGSNPDVVIDVNRSPANPNVVIGQPTYTNNILTGIGFTSYPSSYPRSYPSSYYETSGGRTLTEELMMKLSTEESNRRYMVKEREELWEKIKELKVDCEIFLEENRKLKERIKGSCSGIGDLEVEQ